MTQKKRGGILQIKIIIIGVIIGCSYLIGNYIYNSYTQRHKQVKELIRVLENIRMDLCFSMYTLEEIFEKIGHRKEYSVSNFFYCISKEMKTSSETGLENIILNNKNELVENTYLRQKEIEELIELILNLGKSDLDSQSRLIDLAVENLKQITKDTKEDVELKGMVYKKIATIGGIIVGIVLI